MSTHHLDFVDTDTEFVRHANPCNERCGTCEHRGICASAPVPEMPRKALQLHRIEVAQCCGSCGQGRVACPSPAVCLGINGGGPVREQPASMHPLSSLGHSAVFWACVLGAVACAYALAVN